MSQLCDAPKCERISRAPCDCCGQNLCLQHLCEHNESLVSQLNPLTDEINALGDRLNQFNFRETMRGCREQLEKWRLDCHEKIDVFFKQKSQELDCLFVTKVDEQREQIRHIQTKLAKFIRDQEATRQTIDTLTSTIRHLEKEIEKVEKTQFGIDIHSLMLDDAMIQFKEMYEYEFNPSVFSVVHKTILYPEGSYRALAANDRSLLIHQKPNLAFIDVELTVVRRVAWPYGSIFDICWSTALDRFIVIEQNAIFLIDENTMSIEAVKTIEKQSWGAGTCFKDKLFLSTNVWGSSIIEIKLSPSISVIKEWKCPLTCTLSECIDDMVYNSGALALVIRNDVKNSMHMELRSSKTLDRLWSLLLDVVYSKSIAFRCYFVDWNGWLIADFNSKHLLHITTDGKMKQTIPYKATPYRINMFGPKMLTVVTESNINFHKI